MHCTEAGWNKLHAAHASWVGLFSIALTLPPSGEHFICLWRSRTKRIIQGKIADKGYYVRCNIHFPNNNVGEGEVMRTEQYYPTICSLPPLGLSLLSELLSIYSFWLVCSISLSIHTPTLSFFSVNPLISFIYSVVITVYSSTRESLYCLVLIHHIWVSLAYMNTRKYIYDPAWINFSVIVGMMKHLSRLLIHLMLYMKMAIFHQKKFFLRSTEVVEPYGRLWIIYVIAWKMQLFNLLIMFFFSLG